MVLSEFYEYDPADIKESSAKSFLADEAKQSLEKGVVFELRKLPRFGDEPGLIGWFTSSGMQKEDLPIKDYGSGVFDAPSGSFILGRLRV